MCHLGSSANKRCVILIAGTVATVTKKLNKYIEIQLLLFFSNKHVRKHVRKHFSKKYLNRSDFSSKFSVTSVHLHQSLSESSLVLALTSSCVVDDVPDFELTAYKREGMLSSSSRRR